MKGSQFLPVIISLGAAIVGAWAQYFYKVAADNFSIGQLYKNYHLFLGVICFSLVLVLFIWAFKAGGKMFVIYPVYATTYIWSGMIAHYLLKESITTFQIVGVLMIMIGVVCVALGQST